MEATDKIHILLGGHDLEMLTIRDLLTERGIPFSDKQLRWDNALLSQYTETLQSIPSTHKIYGIELHEDIPLPDNYHTIDHHNHNSQLPSALEQTASLLQIPMNRRMQLIAANDKGYIPGLIAIGATEKEITEIRLADRRAQGVTADDEKLAEQAITENLTHVGELIIIKATSHRFSPICDRLYPYNKLLIYTDNEWIYYGSEVNEIKELFPNEMRQDKLFYGGMPNGYIGLKQDSCTTEEISRMVEKIKLYENGK